MKCILCDETGSFLDKYKFNVESDVEFFGNLNVNYCTKCDLGYASPMPNPKKLDYFYKNIYRAKGRPNEIKHNSNSDIYYFRNLSYLNYLSTFINLDNVKSVFDFGSGVGDLGFLIKSKFQDISLSSIELDQSCINILKKRNYKIYDDFKSISDKFDLIISSLTLQQLSNLNILHELKKISHEDTFIFIEVPNNDFGEQFLYRPYDSPRLIFFTKKSLEKISNLFNLEIINLSYASYSIENAYKYSKENKNHFSNWKKNNFSLKQKIKGIIKKFLPKLFIRFIIYINEQRNIDQNIDNFILQRKNSWTLRGLFKFNKINKKND